MTVEINEIENRKTIEKVNKIDKSSVWSRKNKT